MVEPDLKTLFSCVRNGDQEAFGQIYEALKQPVFTICWRIIQSKETAEDITHDVFVKLYVSPPDPSVKNPRAWVFQMTRNLAIDALRKKKRTDNEEVQSTVPDDYSRIHLRMDLETAMRKLPCLEREILSLHLNGDLKFSEISRIVNLSLPATYRRYRNAFKTLQNELNGGIL